MSRSQPVDLSKYLKFKINELKGFKKYVLRNLAQSD